MMMPVPPADDSVREPPDGPAPSEPPGDQPLPPPNPGVVRFVTACATLVLLLIFWWVAMNGVPPGPVNLPQVGQFAFRSAAQTIGLMIAAIAGFSLVGQASRGRRAGRVLPWALAFLAGTLLLEQHWGVALGFAGTALAMAAQEWTVRKLPDTKAESKTE